MKQYLTSSVHTNNILFWFAIAATLIFYIQLIYNIRYDEKLLEDPLSNKSLFKLNKIGFFLFGFSWTFLILIESEIGLFLSLFLSFFSGLSTVFIVQFNYYIIEQDKKRKNSK